MFHRFTDIHFSGHLSVALLRRVCHPLRRRHHWLQRLIRPNRRLGLRHLRAGKASTDNRKRRQQRQSVSWPSGAGGAAHEALHSLHQRGHSLGRPRAAHHRGGRQSSAHHHALQVCLQSHSPAAVALRRTGGQHSGDEERGPAQHSQTRGHQAHHSGGQILPYSV